MLTPSFSARFAALALAASIGAPAALAQGIASPAGVGTPTLGGSSRMLVQPGYGHHGSIHPRPRPIPAPYNPIVDQDGFVDTEYDPFSNVIDVNRQTLSTRLSAYDPHRDHVDPGSLRRVDRWLRINGQWIREHGMTWTSHGVPHGNLTRDRSTFTPFPGHGHGGHAGHGGVRENHSDTVIYMQPPGSGSSLPGGPGGVRENDSHTVLYMTSPGSGPSAGVTPGPSNPGPSNGGGVRENSSDTVLFSTAPPSQNVNNGAVRPRPGVVLPRGVQRRR
ncbi:hypothetical protein [Alienimonas californiensis]|uniref:Secreted protein n=1 Tax=Alienimonas californiensis TaxID=2527989 RepID=A0A517P902_9PLAN|nr:hypothetical protein [Alienimonas californiensis]QDT15845.1 hypothetical protein CA12_19400 [Alienimonas californiensis]